jgi:hypothetical protein
MRYYRGEHPSNLTLSVNNRANVERGTKIAAAGIEMTRRLPAQSIRERKEALLENWLILCFPSVFLWLLFFWELYKHNAHLPPQPTLILIAAILMTCVFIALHVRLYDRVRRLNRGERGELEVAATLEELRVNGYVPVHDLSGRNGNIDHVVVGPGGVFALETKFRSGSGEISFKNGEGLFVGGRAEEKDVLKQARGSAREINRLIKENCGIERWVTPIVVFVGDWRVRDRWHSTDARVLMPDQLARYFDQRQPELTRNEIKLIASHLERSASS